MDAGELNTSSVLYIEFYQKICRPLRRRPSLTCLETPLYGGRLVGMVLLYQVEDPRQLAGRLPLAGQKNEYKDSFRISRKRLDQDKILTIFDQI